MSYLIAILQSTRQKFLFWKTAKKKICKRSSSKRLITKFTPVGSSWTVDVSSFFNKFTISLYIDSIYWSAQNSIWQTCSVPYYVFCSLLILISTYLFSIPHLTRLAAYIQNSWILYFSTNTSIKRIASDIYSLQTKFPSLISLSQAIKNLQFGIKTN